MCSLIGGNKLKGLQLPICRERSEFERVLRGGQKMKQSLLGGIWRTFQLRPQPAHGFQHLQEGIISNLKIKMHGEMHDTSRS